MARYKWLPVPVVLALVLVAALLSGSHAASVLSGSPPPCLFNSSTGIVPSPNPGDGANQLRGIATIAANDVWAVGWLNNINPSVSRTLAEHWNGTAWSVVPTPNAPTPNGGSGNELRAVSAVASNDVWAVGEYVDLSTFNTLTLTEHWDGSAWSIVPSLNTTDVGETTTVLTGVAAVAANDVWAVGSYTSPPTNHRSVIEHWDGSAWSWVTPPSSGEPEDELHGIAAHATNDIWAVGGTIGQTAAQDQTLIEHWNGAAWSLVPRPTFPHTASLFAVSPRASDDVWVVGTFGFDATSPVASLTEHWNGSVWTRVASPSSTLGPIFLWGVANIAPDDAWAVGELDSTGGGLLGLIVHWNGSSWSVVVHDKIPNATFVVYAAGALSATNVWMVGYYNSNHTGFPMTLVEHYPHLAGIGPLTAHVGPGGAAIPCAAWVCPGSQANWRPLTS